jgi:phage I-like protein
MKILAETLDALGSVALSESGEAPTEIRLFTMGENRTKKGSFFLDVAGGTQAIESFEAAGLDALPFDRAHGMLAGPSAHPDHHKAGAWFVPEMRLDGLWASAIDWTKKGREEVEAKEYRFFSPAITFDSKTRRIVGLTNVALTNLPATLGQKPLVLSGETETEENMTVLLEKLGAADETAALATLSGLLELRDGLVSIVGSAELSAVTALRDERDTLKTEKEALSAAKLASEKSALLSAVPPAHRAFAETLSIEQLSGYVATLPKLQTKIEEKAPDSKSVELSAEDKKTAQLLGLTEEAFLAEKSAGGVN